MKRTYISELLKAHDQKNGEAVKLCGWVRTVRDVKEFGFIELNDGTAHKSVQVVFDKNTIGAYEKVAALNVGSAVTVIGTVVLTPAAQQPFEIKAAEIIIEGESAPDFPMQKKRHTMEFLREKAYLRPRTNTFSAVFRIRSLAGQAIHKFFGDRGFIYVNTPIITGSDCEGAGAMFQVTTLPLQNPPKINGGADILEKPNPQKTDGGAVDYGADFFGKKVGLTVSGQLNAEAFALAFSNVYTFGPTFRAENSNTARHAAEFWMIEPEMAFTDLAGDMDVAEALIKFVIGYVTENATDDLAFLNKFVDDGLLARLKNVAESEFVRLPYTQAVEILEKVKSRFQFPVYWGADLQSEHERYLTEEVYKKPVFLTDYPKEIKAFYMRLNDDGKTVAACDLLVPGIGELIGGSQREERLDILERRMIESGMKPEDYWWYLDLRRFGGTKHAGFGLGFERLIMYLTGISNIRDVIPFPRTVGNCEY